jgi:ribonucleotide reductase alpha subunit
MQAVVANKKLKVTNFGMTYEVDAPAIFTKICESAIRSAEPGVLFTEKLRNYNIMQHVASYNIETTNPCGR